jgi:hypothetical protein
MREREERKERKILPNHLERERIKVMRYFLGQNQLNIPFCVKLQICPCLKRVIFVSDTYSVIS